MIKLTGCSHRMLFLWYPAGSVSSYSNIKGATADFQSHSQVIKYQRFGWRLARRTDPRHWYLMTWDWESNNWTSIFWISFFFFCTFKGLPRDFRVKFRGLLLSLSEQLYNVLCGTWAFVTPEPALQTRTMRSPSRNFPGRNGLMKHVIELHHGSCRRTVWAWPTQGI